MTIPFYTGNIPQPLQQYLLNADNDGNWQTVINYCAPLIETTMDDGVILSYSFALMEEALAIYVDDVEETAEKCLALHKRLQHNYGGTHHWKRMLKRIITDAKKLKIQVNNLLNIPFENLTTKQKSKLAYHLQDIGGIENIKRAAELHLDLIKIQNAETYYHTGQYIVCLYQTNQLEKANETFEDFLLFINSNPTHGYAFLVDTVLQQKLMCYLDNKVEIVSIWHLAKSRLAVNGNNDFPYTESMQDKLLIAAHGFGLQEIVDDLKAKIKAERKPRMISSEILKIIDL
jgi:hypothetical protein